MSTPCPRFLEPLQLTRAVYDLISKAPSLKPECQVHPRICKLSRTATPGILAQFPRPHLSNTSTKTRSIAEHLPIQPPTLIWLPSGSSGSTAKLWAPPPVFESWSSGERATGQKAARREGARTGRKRHVQPAEGVGKRLLYLPHGADRVALGEHEELRGCSAHERARMGLSPSPRNWSLITRGVARSVGGVEWRRWS